MNLNQALLLSLYDSKKNNLAHSLDDSDLVGDVQGVVVRGKADVGLLISSGSHQCVHLRDIDVVQLLDSRLDLVLISLDIADEDQGVVVLDLLHGGLGGQGVLDDVVSIHAVPAGSRLARVLGGSGRPEGLRPVELNAGPDLLDPGAMDTLHNLLLALSGLLDCCYGGLLLG